MDTSTQDFLPHTATRVLRYGVQCTHDPPGTSQVFSVTLPSNGLKGVIPSSIIHLTDLKVLDLSDNEITGSVPQGLDTLDELQMVLFANSLHYFHFLTLTVT